MFFFAHFYNCHIWLSILLIQESQFFNHDLLKLDMGLKECIRQKYPGSNIFVDSGNFLRLQYFGMENLNKIAFKLYI